MSNGGSGRDRMPPAPRDLKWHYEGALDESSDRNIGGSFPVPNATIDGRRGDPLELVRVFGSDQRARQISINVFQHVPMLNGIPTVKGPFLATIEWAAGGANFNSVNVDIPTPTTLEPQFNSLTFASPNNPNPNGLSLSVPAAGVRVTVRDMSREFSIAGTSPGPATAGDRIGFNIGSNVLSNISAFVGYQPLPLASPRTMRRRIVLATPVGTPWAIGEVLVVSVPAYAKRVRFPRNTAEVISVQMLDGTFLTTSGPYTIPPGDIGVLELQPHDIFLRLTNTSAAAIVSASADFDIEV